MQFMFQKPMQSHNIPSFFFVNRMGAPPGELEEQMKPFPNILLRNLQSVLSLMSLMPETKGRYGHVGVSDCFPNQLCGHMVIEVA